jgi:hypothetical protein
MRHFMNLVESVPSEIEIERAIDQLICCLEAYGYIVAMAPIAGQENDFLAALRDAVSKIQALESIYVKRYRFRRMSPKMLSAIHKSLPDPGFGIAIKRE